MKPGGCDRTFFFFCVCDRSNRTLMGRLMARKSAAFWEEGDIQHFFCNGTKKKQEFCIHPNESLYCFCQKALLFRYGSKAGRLCARFSKGPCNPTYIKILRDHKGNSPHCLTKTNKMLKNTYQVLYKKIKILCSCV